MDSGASEERGPVVARARDAFVTGLAVVVPDLVTAGIVVNATASGERLVDGVDAVITRVPGIGTVYDHF